MSRHLGYSVMPVPGVPMVAPGDDLGKLLTDAAAAAEIVLQDEDILCVAQKIVSKAEGRLVRIADVQPSARATELARATDKDPRMVELVLAESSEILRQAPGVLIVRHRLGIVGANAGIDQSNVDHENGEMALLLPQDPDASARNLRTHCKNVLGLNVGVIITDSHNRPWRLGTVGAAIGCAGVNVLDDYRGGADIFGRELKVTLINRADAIAGAATLVMGETTEKVPFAVVRGLPLRGGSAVDESQHAHAIVRPLDEDLFR